MIAHVGSQVTNNSVTTPRAIAAAPNIEPRQTKLVCLMVGLALSLVTVVGAEAQNRPGSFADLAEVISPAVVNITTSTMIAGRTGPQGIVPEGSPFEDFFEEFGENGQRRSSALGSGFVISADGYIVTNNHVIEDADAIEIEFFPGDDQPSKLLPAVIVGTDPNTDIALLKVEYDTPLSFVSFGDSSGPGSRVGDWVMAMGNPLGQGFSVSAGIISARNRSLQGTYDDYIQTDAAINRGNSGGPLFNMDGDVICVNTAILSPNGGSIGIGFAMSSDVVINVVDQLEEFGETRRGWLGVRIQDVTADMIGAIDGLENVRGAMVTDVPAGPAENAGMEAGDIIMLFDGIAIEDTRELVQIVGNSPVGKEVPVEILRSGKMFDLTVVLGRRETAEAAAFPDDGDALEGGKPNTSNMLGMTLSEITPDMEESLGVEAGSGLVIVEVEAVSEAQTKGLMAGDLITEAGQQKISSISDFEARVENAQQAGRKSLLLLVRRDGSPRFVAIALE